MKKPMIKSFALTLAAILSMAAVGCSADSAALENQEFSTESLRINDAFPEVKFLIEEGSIKVFDVSKKKPKEVQTLAFGEVTDLEFSKEMFSAEDLNFDGNMDIRLPSTRGATNVYSYVWLWEAAAEGFVYNEELSALSLLEPDPAKKIITAVESGGAAENLESAYDWVDGKLTLLWEIHTFADVGTGEITELHTERQPDGSYKKTEVKP